MMIHSGECPKNLADKRIVSLDINSIVAGTKYRGQFEERMKVIIEELQATPNIIIFIDEIHTMVGAGNSSGSLDASNIFKPAYLEVKYNVLEPQHLMNIENTLKKMAL
jgi:ATP-dependent Clp protease ATP-binding subunit ClpC